ncbi:hypothetical protein CHS0354_028930 [Potamilus streckersoni]|uniref:Uncharacterized protein n=1 Tax=Potamilus streckersoni TaxID=2493646 RepID=A0AAE0SJ20_9BIVA|nr:hypothetical protein CHS0354_028930 [Potamilus streckersoni]
MAKITYWSIGHKLCRWITKTIITIILNQRISRKKQEPNFVMIESIQEHMCCLQTLIRQDNINCESCNDKDCSNKEIKRMRKDIVRLDEIILSKDKKIKRLESNFDKAKESKLRLGSDLNVMADVIKCQEMVIGRLQAVNKKQTETLSAQIRGSQLQHTNIIQLSCYYANMARSSCPSCASCTANTAPNPSVTGNRRLDSHNSILSDQQE